MAKTNYSYAKRQREIAKKQKKEEKRRQKIQIAEEKNADKLPSSPDDELPPTDPVN